MQLGSQLLKRILNHEVSYDNTMNQSRALLFYLEFTVSES
jgi:hypothetical protein